MNVGIPNETNFADGDLIKSSVRASKERELEERIAYKAIHCPTREHSGGRILERKIKSLKDAIDGLRKSEELAVLSRIVNPSVAEGRILIRIVEGMNSFHPMKQDVLADETLESIDSLKAKRRLIGRLLENPNWHTRNRLHQEYTIELHKYRVNLFKKAVSVPYNEESRQLLKIFESYAGQMKKFLDRLRYQSKAAYLNGAAVPCHSAPYSLQTTEPEISKFCSITLI